jgi:acetate kinase
VRDILVVNAGSTSVKLSLFAGGERGDAAAWSATVDVGVDVAATLAAAPIDLGAVGAVGHRIVHGGDRFDRPVVIDAEVEVAVAALADLAPLHNRSGLDGIAAVRRVVGGHVPAVAVFDTAFHRTIPPSASAYGGPYAWYAEGLRRYGFHGISHEYAARRAASVLGRRVEELRLVTCHLGGGCSLTAVDEGRSIDTTMGFTPLDGLVMATRSGAVDPGLLLHLLRRGATVDEVEEVLERRSGLLGLSGVSADLRRVLAARGGGDERARLAVDVFVHRVSAGVGAMVAALSGVDAVVFTGGIGEHVAEVRSRVAERLAFLGAVVDDEVNRADPVDAVISASGAAVGLVVVKAREDLAIARSVQALGVIS